MAGGVLGYPTTAGSSGGRKSKGETPMGGFGICSTVSRPSSRRVHEPVERCCSCTRHSTCSTASPSARACKCRNAGRQCTDCYCWGHCKNQGWLMPSPTMARGLLGHFLHGADPPATDQRSTTPPVRLPTYFSLRAILAARARRSGARGRASDRKIPKD